VIEMGVAALALGAPVNVSRGSQPCVVWPGVRRVRGVDGTPASIVTRPRSCRPVSVSHPRSASA